MPTFNYPTNFELQQIEPDLVARGAAGRLGLDIMPVRNVNAGEVRWTQQDNFYGLQALRGLDGAPTRVQRIGTKTYSYEPGVFGEFIDITETELTRRAGYAPVGTPIDIADMIVDADQQLINREFDRIEATIWSLLTTGTFSIKLDGPTGTQVGFSDTFAIQTFTAGVAWATSATATPIVNFQAVQQLGQAAGHSVDLGAGAVAYMNSVTSNRMLNNANAADLSGRRITAGNTPNNLADVNRYFAAQNLPQMQVYDNGYQSTITVGASVGPFVKFIPDGKVVVVGKRTSGAQVGNYVKTRNASNGLMPGSYAYTLDRANGVNAERRTPANIERHRGHNGGPILLFPGAVVVMNV
jgi:hypothetical protein